MFDFINYLTKRFTYNFAQLLYSTLGRWSDPLALLVIKSDKMSMNLSGDISKSLNGCIIGGELSGSNAVDLWKILRILYIELEDRLLNQFCNELALE